MTRAIVRIRGAECLLTAEGHATGNEQVCAAVSCLVYALAGYLENAGKGVFEREKFLLESGRARLRCRGDAGVQAAYHMAGIGLLQLAEQFPEYLKADLSKQ